MGPDASVANVAHVIQLAVAPVFLLSGVGVVLNVLTSRLARIIDRARLLEERLEQSIVPPESAIAELALLSRRATLIHRAITLSTSCALLIALVIVALFIGAFLAADLSPLVGIFFVLGMLALIGALVSFLREIFLATETLRFGSERRPR